LQQRRGGSGKCEVSQDFHMDELFLEKFVEDAFDRMQESHRNSITYSDLSSHVVSTERLEFLSDFVPEKVLVSSILPSKALMEN
jgi:hypothetical protein